MFLRGKFWNLKLIWAGQINILYNDELDCIKKLMCILFTF